MSKKPIEPAAQRPRARARPIGAAATPERAAKKILDEFQGCQDELEAMNETLRHAVSSLEEARDRYLDIYEFAPVGYFTLEGTDLIVEANLTGAMLLGEDRERLLQHRFTRYVDPEDRGQWHREILRLALHGGKKSFEMALRRGDGSRFYGRFDCLCRTPGDEWPVLRIALIDISERMQAEEELHIADVAFESREGMLVADANGVIVRVNQAFSRLIGYGAEELVGKTLALLKSEHHDESFHENLWSTLKQTHHWVGDIRVRRKNGEIHSVWLVISAVTAPDGRATHYLGTFSDVTRNAEAEHQRLTCHDPHSMSPNRSVA
ncbi:MAG: PAS domain-containing protein [Gammaproteobacteria bacterium]|nr:PAS domain-containing protein [Gammaproteobacteria bacterium]